MNRPNRSPTTSIQEHLDALGSCGDERAWIATQKTRKQAWEMCARGDWMLWYCAKVGVDRKLVVRAACLCAREVLVHVPKDELRPLKAIETAEAWCRGSATIEQVRAAAYAAYAAYAAADAARAAAAYAADADAAHDARAARAAAYAAASACAAAAARTQSRARSADLVRSVIPWAVVRDASRVMQ